MEKKNTFKPTYPRYYKVGDTTYVGMYTEKRGIIIDVYEKCPSLNMVNSDELYNDFSKDMVSEEQFAENTKQAIHAINIRYGLLTN